jgi:phosphoribosylanthranilate isomerase
VSDEDLIGAATEVAPKVDAILLDSSNLTLAIQELGGTGRVHYWTLSEDSRANRRKPVFLAENPKADNVRSAVEASKPLGIDVRSGVGTGP